jgi:hypothetical protein
MHDSEEPIVSKADKLFDKFLLICAYVIMTVFISVVLYVLLTSIDIHIFGTIGLLGMLKVIGVLGCIVVICKLIHWSINKIIDSK